MKFSIFFSDLQIVECKLKCIFCKSFERKRDKKNSQIFKTDVKHFEKVVILLFMEL